MTSSTPAWPTRPDGPREVVDFTNPYLIVNLGVAVRENSTLTKEDFLSGNVSIGTLSGSTVGAWISDHMNETNISSLEKTLLYPVIADTFTAMNQGDCDAVIYEEFTVNLYTSQGLGKKVGTIETNEQYAVAVPKGNAEMMQMLNDGIAKLKASPKWDELTEKYQITPS